MSSKLGKINISKPDSVNTVSSTSTSKLMLPPPPRLPKKTRRFVVPTVTTVPSVPVVPTVPTVSSVQVVPSENVRKRKLTVPVVPNVPNVPSENLRKRRRAEDNSTIWIFKHADILDKIWEKNRAEQRNKKVNNTLDYLVQAIDSIEKRNEEKKQKIDWINRNVKLIYLRKKSEFLKRQRIRRNEEIANNLSMGSNDKLKETILRFLNKCHN